MALQQHGSAGHALPRRLPLSQRLKELFEPRINQLPAATRRLLLLAALDSIGGSHGPQTGQPTAWIFVTWRPRSALA